MLRDDIMAAIQAQPQTTAELGTQFGISERHVRRILADLPITATRDGRQIVYSAAEEAAASSSSTITGPAKTRQIADNCGHGIADMSAINSGHLSLSGDQIADNCGHDSGHAGKETAKQRHRFRKTTARSHTPAPPAAQSAPGCEDCSPADAHRCRTCPLSYAELERDTIQFVIVDQEFRDRLVEQATLKHWRRKNERGLTWIYPSRDITLQAGGDVVVFYSAEPEDLDPIARWVKDNFTLTYSDIGSLIRRIRRPAELKRDELTIIVTDQETIREMEFSLHMKMEKTGTFLLRSPNPVTPGFKAYREGQTLRCEFDCRDDIRKISGLRMRRRLLEILPRVRDAPGLFDEFLTDYYNPYEHPIIIDTGVDSIIQQFKGLAENLTDKFLAAMHEFTQARPVQATLPDETPAPLASVTKEVEALDGFDIEAIVKAFAATMKLERKAALVYLAAFSVWHSRHYAGRVLKEDIASTLQKTGDPLSVAEIADAIDRLIAAGLMKQDPRLEVCFSEQGWTLGKKLVAKQEGIE